MVRGHLEYQLGHLELAWNKVTFRVEKPGEGHLHDYYSGSLELRCD
jgi:hypothetical protein